MLWSKVFHILYSPIFIQLLLYCIPTVLGIGMTAENKPDKVPILMEITI